MLKSILFFILMAAAGYCNAQINVYVRFTDYNNTVITDGVVRAQPHTGEIPLTTFSDNDEQTLNIGSQSTGAGAGKVTFNPTTFSKSIDASSPVFFSMLASGTPFGKVEFSFYNATDTLLFRQTLSLVAFKSIQRAAASCSGDCPGVIENYSVEYGKKVLTIYPRNANGTAGTPISRGWNRIKNVKDDDPALVIN